MTRAYRTRAALLACAALVACVPHRMYRTAPVEHGDGHAVAFVEFDDQGELWSNDQLESALETIRAANDSEPGAIVLLFVHGWNHDASEGDRHVAGFRSILAQLVREELARGGARPVVGVYLGWRGRNVRVPLLLPFSFFNRRGAAERIAGTAAATEVIYRTALTAKENPASRVVLLGHSFGGLIVERAVTQAMVGAVLEAGQRDRLFPADAVILLNPASQAIQAKVFIETLERDRVRLYRTDSRGRRYERPLIVSVTSSQDQATRRLFPVGLRAKGLSKKFRSYEGDNCTPIGRQRAFYRRTAGHSGVMLSHTIAVADPAAMVPERTADLEGGFGSVSASYDPVTQKVFFSFAGAEQTFDIRKRPRASNDSPYWIMRAPGELIDGHSDIFSVDTVRLIGAILAVTGALEAGGRTELVLERGIRPVELTALADDRLVILDQGRRIYLVDGELAPAFSGCVPDDVDAADRVGLEFDESGGRVVLNRTDAGVARYLTEVFRIRLTDDGPVLFGDREIEASGRFPVAAFDLDGERLLLATGAPGEVLVADLGRRRPEPLPYLRLEELAPVSELEYDPVHRRLYLTDGRSGSVLAIDERAGAPAVHVVGRNLGLPIAIAADGERDALYVIDASGGDVLRFACGADLPCAEPTVFASRSEILAPSQVEVATNGDVWVASLESQRVIELGPEGRLLRTVEEWP